MTDQAQVREPLTLLEHADATRHDAEQGSLHVFRWHHQRAAAFKDASESYMRAGRSEHAQAALWDASLWFTATASLGAGGDVTPYFRPLATLVEQPNEAGQPDDVGPETRAIIVGDPAAIPDEARAYYDRRLDEDTLTPLIRARYADFLFDQGYKDQKAPRSTIDYARMAVDAYLMAADAMLNDPTLTIEASRYFLRAATIARRMNSSTDLIPRVHDAVVVALTTLRTQRRYRHTIDLTRALLMLGPAATDTDLHVAEGALRDGASAERDAGQPFAERAFLAALEDLYTAMHDASAKDSIRRQIAASYEADAAARAPASHLAAAALLEDAAHRYQTLHLPKDRDRVLAAIKREYQAGENEYGSIEVQGHLPQAEIDALYDAVLAPLPIGEALRMLGVHPAVQPRYRQAVELAQHVIQTSPLLGVIAPRIIRDDAPTRRSDSPDEIAHAQTIRQFVHIINVTGIVVAVLLQRLEHEKGLNAEVFGHYFEAWPPMDAQHLPFLRCGLERYYAGDYISALHILTPQIEGVLRSLLWQGGVTVTGLNRDGTGIDADTLSGLLRRKDVQDILTDDLWHYLDTTLSSSQGLNLRNDIAHGLIKPGQVKKVTCVIVIHLLLCLTRFELAPTHAETMADETLLTGEKTEEKNDATTIS